MFPFGSDILERKNGAEHFSVSGRQLAALFFNSKLLDPVGVVAAHLP